MPRSGGWWPTRNGPEFALAEIRAGRVAHGDVAVLREASQDEAEARQRVLANAEWMSDVDLCPADFMTSRMRVRGLVQLSCQGEELPGCYSRCKSGDVDSCY